MVVGVSPVALVVHWPTDVIGAWLPATSVVLLVLPVRDRLRRSELGPGHRDELDGGGESEPGAGHRDELGDGDRSGRREDDDEGQKSGEKATTRPGAGSVRACVRRTTMPPPTPSDGPARTVVSVARAIAWAANPRLPTSDAASSSALRSTR
jgi:hypothetical protein